MSKEKSLAQLSAEFWADVNKAQRKPKRQAKRRLANFAHESMAAGVHPDDVLAAKKHAAANGFGDVDFTSDGKAVMRNHSPMRWRKYLKTIGMADYQHG